MNDTATALLAAVDDLAVAAARPGLSGREHLSRASMLRDAVADRDAAAAAGPYTSGEYCLVGDLLASGRDQAAHRDVAPDVVARLATHRTGRALRAAIVPQILADTPGLSTTRPSGLPFEPGSAVAPLLALADPFTPNGATVDLPAAWSTPAPPGVLDPAEKTMLTTLAATVDVIPTPWHWAAYGLNLAMQVLDWTTEGGRRIEDHMASVVNATLEIALVADLVAAAGTAAADLDAAEAAAGTAWGTAVDTLVVNPADWPKVRRGYAPQAVPFTNVAVTASIVAGTALVFPRGSIYLLAEPMEWSTVVEPALLGKAVTATRAGLAAPRRDGVVATATITAAQRSR